MSPELLKSICQLTSVVELKKLDLGRNTLTGQLHYLLYQPHQGFKSLEILKLFMTKLNKNDIKMLTQHMLPELKELNLWDNKLYTMQRETEELIRTCVTHYQRELELNMYDRDLSEETKEKRNQLCQGTHVNLWF